MLKRKKDVPQLLPKDLLPDLVKAESPGERILSQLERISQPNHRNYEASLVTTATISSYGVREDIADYWQRTQAADRKRDD